jgi:hypothetical protein
LTEIEELRKFKSDHEKALGEKDEADARAAGEFEKLEKKLRDKITEVETDRDTRVSDVRSRFFKEGLMNLLSAKGVRPEMAKYALIDAENEFELGDDFTLKLKNGIGDAGEIDGYVAKLREATPDFFTPTTQSGGGASGSGINNGGGKTMPKSQWDTLDHKAQAAFIKDGGKPVD